MAPAFRFYPRGSFLSGCRATSNFPFAIPECILTGRFRLSISVCFGEPAVFKVRRSGSVFSTNQSAAEFTSVDLQQRD